MAGLLVDSELRGHRDHGVAALGLLTTLYRRRRSLNPRPDVARAARDRRRAAARRRPRLRARRADAGDASGASSVRASARAWPVAAVRDWQLLVAAPYARLAADAGLIGFACTNFIPLVAPPGGRTPVLGTNPFAYGLPGRGDPPVVLDIAAHGHRDAEGPRRRLPRASRSPPG